MSITVIQWQSVFILFKTMNKVLRSPENRRSNMLLVTGILLSAMLLGSPMMIEIATMSEFESGEGVALGDGNLAIWLVVLGSLVTFAVYGYRLHLQNKIGQSGFWSVGPNVIGILIGAYMLFTAIDHISFFSPFREDAGIVNWTFFQEYKEISDVECNSEIMIVKGMESDKVTYRCPKPMQLVLGRFSSKPYMPWPGYSEGTSTELVLAFKELQEESKQLTD